MPGEKVANEPLTLDEELKISIWEYIDMFQQEINMCCQCMDGISLRFAILETRYLLKSSETGVLKLVGCLVENLQETC
jgi:hypothetical protein